MENINYDDYVRKHSSTFIKVILSNNKVEIIKNFVKKIIKAKISESHHLVDSGMEEKRWTTGFLGESAVEQFLKINFIDLSIGSSQNYHVSDLKKVGYDCGIKTVEKENFLSFFENHINLKLLSLNNQIECFIFVD
tara:strand:- start:116 stop:523 length:408 start_codon:yes stop_codon:yes gene_type:complete